MLMEWLLPFAFGEAALTWTLYIRPPISTNKPYWELSPTVDHITPVAALPGLMPLYQGGLGNGLHGVLLHDQELFFSGHTGVPFLYFLLCRRRPAVAYACLAMAGLNGVGVLLTRNHYSIDVLGAFFIVPTIAALTRIFFGRLDPEPGPKLISSPL